MLYNYDLQDEYNRLIASLPVDAPMDDFNDVYLKAVKKIESQAPKKKMPSKADFGVGDTAHHYYAVLVLSQS